MDEPESLGGALARRREGLDNLTFVVNCNLQRLDGPGPRQRQDHPGARGGLPRRRLERHQGRLGPRVGRAARPRRRRRARRADERHARRRVPEVHRRRRRLHPRALLRAGPAPAQAGRAPHRRRPRKLRRGGHDYRKVYAAYKAATEFKRRADGDPRQDRQGLDARPGRRGAQHHPPGQEAHRAGARVFRDRLELPIPDDKLKDAPYYHPAPGLGGGPVPARAPARARRPLPSASCRAAKPPAPAPEVDAEFARAADGRVDDDGLHPAAAEPHPRPGPRAAASCRSSPTRRAPSAWTRCSRRSASTRRSASATSRSTPTSSSRTARRSTARSSRRASPRPARWPASRPPARRTRRTASR